MNSSNNNISILSGESFDLNEPIISEYRYKWANNPANHIVEKYPLHLDVEITNNCNLKCSFCASTIYNYDQKGFMDFDLFKKIVDESADMGLYALKLNWRGEPLLHKQVVQMVKYAKEKKIPDVFINTNDYFLDRDMSQQLIEAGIDRIIISFEGYTQEVYEKYRVGSDFDLVRNNIIQLNNLKKSKKPRIRIQSVGIPEIKGHEKEYRDFWKDLADEVSIINYRDEKELYGKMNSDNSWQCPYLWLRLTIAYDGAVYPCCFVTKKPDMYCGDYSIGNVMDNSIADLWHSEKMNEYRDLHCMGQSCKIDICSMCSYRGSELEKIEE